MRASLPGTTTALASAHQREQFVHMALPEIDLSLLSPDEKWALINVIWASLESAGDDSLSDEDRVSLDRAIAEAEANPGSSEDWESFRARLLKTVG